MNTPTQEAPEAVEARVALGHARRHLKVHMDWVRHLKAGGELPHPKIGGLAHHEEAVENYSLICKVLRRAVEPASADLQGESDG